MTTVAWARGFILVVLMSPTMLAQLDTEGVLAEAQGLRRQGRMHAASATLDRLGTALTEHQRGRVLLVRGNIAFECLDYPLAIRLYRESEGAFEQARFTDESSGMAGAAAARENLARAKIEDDRRRSLGERAATVRAAASALVLLGTVAVGLLALRSRRGPELGAD